MALESHRIRYDSQKKISGTKFDANGKNPASLAALVGFFVFGLVFLLPLFPPFGLIWCAGIGVALFKELDQVIRPDAIVATNSSYMVSSLFKDSISNPSRLLNCHYYNPALVMKFVEVVQGPHTDPACAEAVMEFCRKCGKTPIWMKKEISGFAANRIISVINAEARYLVQNGYLTYEEVDIACELGLGHPMGPFRLTDMTGVDLTLDLMNAGMAQTGEKPDCYEMFEQMVKDGHLGRKTGKGFYEYK